ncbi:MAG: aminotransferase class V-fold PLP-dependent enzyme [Alphaproteobacteria bacterium]|nr:aminotransferase class V-fold PLP-dependent enzyme [Alphaproteobacteria bacterium]HPF46777.1 aminotransferase class V-fold PLP-dependent enzyme [Emcibacteraceae bacterium]HRW29711.1 aminotransferase class V-fold PLP-dependent enzyme [Emcibacteraceae bacterium]
MLKCQKNLFDIPADVTYLNAAYMGPLTKEAVEIGKRAVARKMMPWSIAISEFFELPDRIYDLTAKLIGAQPDDMAIVPSVSYGIAVAAKNIPVSAGQKIIVLADQFPSNIYPWLVLAEEKGAIVETVGWPENGNWTEALINAIDNNTAIVATANAHWTNGTLIDLVEVSKKTKKMGAALVLDLSQTLGVMPFSVKDVDPDYMVVVGYKWLLGPFSFGYLYVAPRNQNGKPLEESWIGRRDAHDFARLVDYKDGYESGARRFDMGEKSNFIHAPIAASVLEYLLDLGVENIAGYLKSLTDYIAERATAIGLNVAGEEQRVPNLIGINFKGGVPAHIAPALTKNNIFVSIRGDSIRVSPHIYNDKADIDRFFDVLESEL